MTDSDPQRTDSRLGPSVFSMMVHAARQAARPLFFLAPCQILCGTAVAVFSVWMPQFLLQQLSDGLRWTVFLPQYLLLIARVGAGQLSPARFVFYVGAISQISASVMTMIRQYNKLRDQHLQLGELRAFLAPAGTARPARPLPAAGSPCTIELKDVSFRYSPEGPWRPAGAGRAGRGGVFFRRRGAKAGAGLRAV